MEDNIIKGILKMNDEQKKKLIENLKGLIETIESSMKKEIKETKWKPVKLKF